MRSTPGNSFGPMANSATTAMTTIQCQMLSEPILQPSKHARPATRPNLYRKLGAGGVKNKDLSRVKSLLTRSLAATVNRAVEANGEFSFRPQFPALRQGPTRVPDRRSPGDPRHRARPGHPTALER